MGLVGGLDAVCPLDSFVMILSGQYLLFASSIAFFRVGVYLLYPKTVTQVKIASQAWEDVRIQEISFAYTNTIRTLMLFKGVIFLYCSYMKDTQGRDAIALISFGFDLWMWFMMIRKMFSKTQGDGSLKALLPPTTSAMTIQSILTTSYLFFFGLEYFGFLEGR